MQVAAHCGGRVVLAGGRHIEVTRAVQAYAILRDIEEGRLIETDDAPGRGTGRRRGARIKMAQQELGSTIVALDQERWVGELTMGAASAGRLRLDRPCSASGPSFSSMFAAGTPISR